MKRTDWMASKLSPITLLVVFSLSMIALPVVGFFMSKAIVFEGEGETRMFSILNHLI